MEPETPKKRLLHFTWKTRNLPEDFVNYCRSCTSANPNWVPILWTDQDIDTLMRDQFPQYQDSFSKFDFQIERVDFFRLAVLYQLGGAYFDLDVECFQGLDPLLAKYPHKILLVDEAREHAEVLYEHRKHLISNAVMIAPSAKHPFWIRAMDFIVKNYRTQKNKNPVYRTGPAALTFFYEQHPEAFADVVILSPCVFMAQTDKMSQIKHRTLKIPWLSKECDSESKDGYIGVHRYTHTWVRPSTGQRPHLGIGIGLLVLLVVTLMIIWILVQDH
jgi:hypothetical protein